METTGLLKTAASLCFGVARLLRRAEDEQIEGTPEGNATASLLVAGDLHHVVPAVCLFPQSTSRVQFIVFLPCNRLCRGILLDISCLPR